MRNLVTLLLELGLKTSAAARRFGFEDDLATITWAAGVQRTHTGWEIYYFAPDQLIRVEAS